MSSLYRNPAIATIPLDEREWKLVRKAQPANIVLPATRRWANALPRGLEPQALLRQFPRIANRIANAWTDVLARRLIFEDLLVDRRPQRKGFPADVLHDLLRLRAHCAGEALPKAEPYRRHWSARRMSFE